MAMFEGLALALVTQRMSKVLSILPITKRLRWFVKSFCHSSHVVHVVVVVSNDPKPRRQAWS